MVSTSAKKTVELPPFSSPSSTPVLYFVILISPLRLETETVGRFVPLVLEELVEWCAMPVFFFFFGVSLSLLPSGCRLSSVNAYPKEKERGLYTHPLWGDVLSHGLDRACAWCDESVYPVGTDGVRWIFLSYNQQAEASLRQRVRVKIPIRLGCPCIHLDRRSSNLPNPLPVELWSGCNPTTDTQSNSGIQRSWSIWCSHEINVN